MSKPLRGSVRVELPNGELHRFKLPNASKVRIGGKGNFLVTYTGHVFLFWLVRVKGGWMPAEQSGVAHGIAAIAKGEAKPGV